MSKIAILKLDASETGTLDLPKAFLVKPKKELLHQAVTIYLANQRQANAHTKTRGEVAGGGRKPWKQKGTGRARAGSRRSPIWIGGGITFGPRNSRNYSKQLPEKMRRLALAMALSVKAEKKQLVVIENLALEAAKTKILASALSRLAPDSKMILIITEKPDATLYQAARNLPTVALTPVSNVTTYDLLAADKVIITKTAVEAIDKRALSHSDKKEEIT